MSFKELSIKQEYRSPQDNVVQAFYLPVLGEAVSYKRSVGFFSSSALIQISKGICELAKKGGSIELVASPHLSEEDMKAIGTGYENRAKIIENALLRNLSEKYEAPFEQERLNFLANLIEQGILNIKIAFTENENSIGMYHEKLGLIEDFKGNKIAFSGSMNESANAMYLNYEAIDVFCTWKGSEDKSRVIQKEEAFSRIWGNYDEKLVVKSFPSIDKAILQKYKRHSLTVSDWNIDKDEENSNKYKIDNSNMSGNQALSVAEPDPDYPASKIIHLPNIPKVPDDVHFYEYQQEAINNWSENSFTGIFDMATGTGKTLTGLGAITKCCESNKNNLAVIIVAPYQHLVEQWVEDIKRFNIKPIIGYSTSSQKDWKERLKRSISDKKLRSKGFFLLVTTNATFKSKFVQEQINLIDGDILLLIDEAHNAGAGDFKKYLDSRFRYRLALSATLDRHNDEEGTSFLHNYFGKVCIHYDLERAIKEHKLTPYKYYPVLVYLTEEELAEYKQISAEILQRGMSLKNGKRELNETGKRLAIKRSRIVAGAQNKLDVFREQIIPYADKHNILVYCGAANVLLDSDFYSSLEDFDKSEIGERQIIAITKILGNEMNMAVSRFTSEEDIETRQAITQSFKNEDIQAIVAIKCLDEGVNIPSIKTAFILASTTNPKEYIQRRGRVLRKWPGKDYAEIYDFVTLPRELDTVLNFTEEEVKNDLSLVKNELRRLKEFSSIAMNKMESLNLIDEIQETYNITDKDLFGENSQEEIING